MKAYRLFTSTGNETAIKLCKATGNPKICEIATSNIPEISEIRDFSERDTEAIADLEIINILSVRLSRLKKNRLSVVLSVGEPDYLSTAFLERGLRSSLPVCLIKQGYLIEDLIAQIKDKSVDSVQNTLQLISEKVNLSLGKFQNNLISGKKYKLVSDALSDKDIQQSLSKAKGETVFTPFATGFLVGKNYLLTNFHVFNEENKGKIKQFVAQFGYQQDALGQNSKTVDYPLDPDAFTISNEQLDYTLVKVGKLENYKSQGLVFPEAGDNFGWLPMLADPTVVAPPFSRLRARLLAKRSKNIDPESIPNSRLLGDPVFVIQHPQGGQKKVVLFSNRVQNTYQRFLQYEADADFGSSGSPILNARWQLVGLHHAALAKWNDKRKEIEVQGNLGIRICEIVKHLKAIKASRPEVNAFLNNKRYIIEQGETPFQGTIYILTGYSRSEVPSERHRVQEVEIAKTLIAKALSSSGVDFPIQDVLQASSGDYSAGIQYINQQNNDVGDVALEIRTSFYPDDVFSIGEPQGVRATIFYSAEQPTYKAYAEIVLQALLSKNSRLSNVVQSDTAIVDAALEFCRDVNIPSLVLSLDFFGMTYEQITEDNPAQQRKPTFDLGLLEGLELWVRVLSPIGFWSVD